jgi:hypothetical protein
MLMKKTYSFLIALVVCLLAFWTVIYFNKPIVVAPEIPEDSLQGEAAFSWHQGEFIVAGIWPDISFESVVGPDVLVLHQQFEDHSDHLFIDKALWEPYGNATTFLPGDRVSFSGSSQWVWLEGAAGNHYYKVVSFDTLEKVWIPTTGEIDQLLKSYTYCEQDSDCTTFYADCPFGCGKGINLKFVDIAQEIIQQYRNQQAEPCVYRCANITGVHCENYTCISTQSEVGV